MILKKLSKEIGLNSLKVIKNFNKNFFTSNTTHSFAKINKFPVYRLSRSFFTKKGDEKKNENEEEEKSTDKKSKEDSENKEKTKKETEQSSEEEDESTKEKAITKEKYRELKTLYTEQSHKLEVVKKKFEEVRNAYLDNKDETDRIKSRYDKEIVLTKEFAITKFAKDVLDVHDNFGRAFNSIEGKDFKDLSESEKIEQFNNFVEGIQPYNI